MAALRGRLLRLAVASPLTRIGASSATAPVIRVERALPTRTSSNAMGPGDGWIARSGAATATLTPLDPATAMPRLRLGDCQDVYWIDTVDGLGRVRSALCNAAHVGIDTEWAEEDSVLDCKAKVDEGLPADRRRSMRVAGGEGTKTNGDTMGHEGTMGHPTRLAAAPPGRSKSREDALSSCRLATIQLAVEGPDIEGGRPQVSAPCPGGEPTGYPPTPIPTPLYFLWVRPPPQLSALPCHSR